MTAIPPSASIAPAASQRVSATPSTTRSQISATAIYTPPYAAYVRPAALGCSVSSHANSASDSAAGTSSHTGRPPFSTSHGR